MNPFSVFARGKLPNGWRAGPIANAPKADKRMSPARTWKDQPPRLEHKTGFRVALYKVGILAGGAVELAAVQLPAKDVEELRELLKRWLEKNTTEAERAELSDLVEECEPEAAE